MFSHAGGPLLLRVPPFAATREAHPRQFITAACSNLVSMPPVRASSPTRRKRKTRSARPASWQLQDAKARFSEVVRRAKQEGPQYVTVHGREEVVVVGAEDFRELAGERTGKALVEAMRQSPHRSINVEPSRVRMRVCDVEL